VRATEVSVEKIVVSLQMPEHGECPQCADVRVLQLLSQRRSSVALILADGCDCLSWLSEGHSSSEQTYLVKVRVVGGRACDKEKFEFEGTRKLRWVPRLAGLAGADPGAGAGVLHSSGREHAPDLNMPQHFGWCGKRSHDAHASLIRP
jgi:hypothetical protein